MHDHPTRPFPLAETTRLACIDREPDGDGPELRLGFGRNHTWEPTGVTVTQRGTAVTVDGDRAARLQVERILASASTPPASPMPAPAIR